MHWPAQQQRNEQGNTRLRYVDNLKGHLKRTAKASQCLGGARTGAYYGLWEATAPTMNWKASTHSTSVDQSTNRKNNAAYTPQGPPSTGECPLCGRPDSIGYMVGECTHPEITALRVERHNTNIRFLLEQTRKGEHGGHCIPADVGNPERVDTVGVKDELTPK